MKSLLAGRRRLAAAIAALAVIVVVLVVMLLGGSGGKGRPYPGLGDSEDVTSQDALRVSFIRDFAIGADDTIYLAVGEDDDPRAVVSIAGKGERSTVVRSGKGGDGIAAARALALGRDDLLYVADADGKGVISRSRAGKVTRIGAYGPAEGAADTAPGLTDVSYMTVNPASGDVYLADEYKIDRLKPDGTLTTIVGVCRTDTKLESALDIFFVEFEQSTGPARQFRFNHLEGLAFVPDTGDLYAVDYGRLLRIDPEGTLVVPPRGDLSVGDALVYDARRKNLYVGVRSLVSENSGIARIDFKGDALILSGSDLASGLTDQLAVDSRGNVYWLFDGIDVIIVIGDLFFEIWVDLKKQWS